MRRGKTIARPNVRSEFNYDLDTAAMFTPAECLMRPRTIVVELPPTDADALDGIKIEVEEGDWQHSCICVDAVVGGGMPDARQEGWRFGGCIRPDQLERFITALQSALKRAKREGILTSREEVPCRSAA